MFVIDLITKDAEVGELANILMSCESMNPVLVESKLVSVADKTEIQATAQ